MSKFLQNQVILAAVESSYAVDATPGNTDALVVQDLAWSFADARLAERNVSTGSKLGAPRQFAGSNFEMTFNVDLKGSGTIDVPPEFGTILQACGFSETINAATDVTYKADSDDEKSATIYFDDDGDEWKVVGVRGSAKINMAAGEFGKLEFTLKGRLSQEPATAPGYSPTYDTTIPVALLNVPLTLGGQLVEQSQYSVDLRGTLVSPSILNNANGYGEVRQSRRQTELAITVFPPNVATGFDPVTDYTTGAVKAISIPVVGSTAGNRYQILMPGGVQLTDLSPGDEDGLVSYEMTADALETAIGADDELSIVFT